MSQDARTGAALLGTTLHQVFEDRVRQAPDAVALRFGTEQMSYDLLNQRANRLAWFLRERRLPAEGLVAVSMERSPDLIVAMLAVLKAGGAYVPVEPSAPQELIRRVLEATRPFAVLTHESQRARLADAVGSPLVCLDSDAAQIARQPTGPLLTRVGPRDLACVFFTSGSSGPPKGSFIEHRNLLTALRGWLEVFGFTPADRHLQTTTFEFDVFTGDWLRALGSGGTLVLAERNFTLDRTAGVEELHALVSAERITVMETSTLLGRRLSAYLLASGAGLGDVRLLMVGAAKWYLDEHLRLQEHLGDRVRVVNTYGVAEAAIDNTYFEVSMLRGPAPDHPGRISIIGKPFPGTEITVVDAAGAAVPAGQPGEIRIGGPAVGRGYLVGGKPPPDGLPAELSVQLPVQRPASRSGADIAPRHHYTGDIGVIRQDGLLEYVGRVEDGRTLEEACQRARLEAVIREHPRVSDCVVANLARDGGAPGLAAYVVPADPDGAFDAGPVFSIADGLDAVVPLPALPRTRAGKIDLSRLPLPAPRESLSAPAGAGWAGSRKGAAGTSLKGSGPAGVYYGSGSGCLRMLITVPGCVILLIFFGLVALLWTMGH